MKTVIAAALTALTLVGCGPAKERVLLDQFFAASRLRDLTALRKFSTVVFEPASDGIVTSFEIVGAVDRGAARELMIVAPVKMFDGRMVTKRFAVTMAGGLVTAISEPPAPGPVAGSASPSTPPR
jgi:hypothetical protein